MLALFVAFCLALTIALAAARYFASMYQTSAPAGRRVASYSTLDDKPQSLSVVIPCYNEEKRLTPMLRDTLQFLSRPATRSIISDFELVLVNDCSRDATIDVAHKFFETNFPTVKYQVVSYSPNAGKGMAVRRGFFASTGEYVLMVDADNATKIDDLAKLMRVASDEQVPVVVGSRAHMEDKAVASRTFVRTLLMKAFHFVVFVTYFCGTYGSICPIRDTQCGFKLFHRKKSMILFLNNRLERWAFDVELLVLAKRCGMAVREVSVVWEEVPGSKVRLSGMIQMGLECLLMCVAYPLQLWKIISPSPVGGAEKKKQK